MATEKTAYGSAGARAARLITPLTVTPADRPRGRRWHRRAGEGVLAGEAPVDGADPHAGQGRDVLDAGVGA
jgi:hypothetical protein